MNSNVEITLTVNGEMYQLAVEPWRTLLWVLREKLNLTGVKEGCGTGECGACTVIMDGKVVNSCLVLAPMANGKSIITIEGMSKDGKLHPIQEAFLKEGGSQCGFCTPGMILTAKEILDENPNPTEQEILQGLDGNLCRCTGYVKIVKAIQTAAAKMRE
ncbi:(2Fe-2S)-binding protein [Thermoanaerobacteraceae bacterium SP2]|nr:(2Fe-2S)-binding protein [Thermoanaerobacteraceae bacterium SP2]